MPSGHARLPRQLADPTSTAPAALVDDEGLVAAFNVDTSRGRWRVPASKVRPPSKNTSFHKSAYFDRHRKCTVGADRPGCEARDSRMRRAQDCPRTTLRGGVGS